MKRIITVCAGAVLIAGLIAGCSGNSGQVEVTTAAAKSGRDLSSMVWQGTVEALSTIDVLPSASGKITGVSAKEGQHVAAGDPLFQIDNTDAALSLAQAQAGYDAAQAAFTTAKKASKQNTSVAPAQIEYNDAQNNFDRIQELYDASVISQADYESAKSRMETAKSKLQAAKNGQEGNLNAARAQMDSSKAALDIAQKRFDDCNVTAPITGMVAALHVEQGQAVSPQTAGATIIDDSDEKVEIKVADTDIDQLKSGMPMTVNLQSAGQTLNGSISEISAICDPKTGMYTVKVLLDTADAVHYTGLIADVRAAGGEAAGSVFIPSKCLQAEDGKSFVYAVVNGSAVKKTVTTGRKKNAYIEIKAGLSQGDEVVMQSSKPLTDGVKVRVLTVK